MATMRDVIRAYRPELEMEDPVEVEEVVSFLAEKSELTADQVHGLLQTMGELAFWYLVRARPITLPGIGRLHPTIDIKGTIRAGIETDPTLVEKMNQPGEYRAGINRRENVGVSLERLAQMWNSANPDDPVADFDAYSVPAG